MLKNLDVCSRLKNTKIYTAVSLLSDQSHHRRRGARLQKGESFSYHRAERPILAITDVGLKHWVEKQVVVRRVPQKNIRICIRPIYRKARGDIVETVEFLVIHVFDNEVPAFSPS